MSTVAAILKQKGNTAVPVSASDSISTVVRELAAHRLGALVVTDARGDLLGMLSERDVVRALASNGPWALEMTVEQLMTRAVKTCSPQCRIEEAMDIMHAGHFRHLPVVERGKLVGMISIRDVLNSRVVQKESEVDNLRAYVAGAYVASAC